MKLAPAAILLALALSACGGAAPAPSLERRPPLSLNPQNSRYFLFRGKPMFLITSGEHYGAVLNLDFDYDVYLKTLQADGLNHTRLFTGTYREIPGSFGITDNTLAPLPNRYACPWARSGEPGYAQGGNKFDLTKWDPAYFARLRDFMAKASAAGIIVELTLWCPNYDEALWKSSPLHASNNVNGVGNCGRDEPYTLRHKDMLAVQEATVRKIVAELRDFDNLYYEICNEPYFGGVTLDWQRKIADVIVAAEGDLPLRHLISQNIANGRAKVQDPHPAVSIWNFHYCVPPDVIALNAGLNGVIGENETGFRGKEDVLYRSEAWEFLLSGGGLYNNLDYSFSAKHPDGTLLNYTSPGGGNPSFRRQLRILKQFLGGFDYVSMSPAPELLKSVSSDHVRGCVLSESGKQYALYFHAPPGGGAFSVRWSGFVDPPASGTYVFTPRVEGGVRLWVNDRKLVDAWSGKGVSEENGAVALEAGRRVRVVMEYTRSNARSTARLEWAGPDGRRGVIPKERLFLAPQGGPGLQSEYFEDRQLKTRRFSRTDDKIDFDWSARGPFPLDGRQRSIDILVDLPSGTYAVDWVNTKTGTLEKNTNFSHAGGPRSFASPLFIDDVALRLLRR